MTITSKIHNTYNTVLILLNTTAIVALAVVLFIQTPAAPLPYIDPILLSERVASRVVVDLQHAAFVRHIEVRLQRLEHAQRLATSNTLATH